MKGPIQCGMLDVEILPDGTSKNIECGNVAAITFRHPRCPTCTRCYEEVFNNGHVKDLGGVEALKWVYFQTC